MYLRTPSHVLLLILVAFEAPVHAQESSFPRRSSVAERLAVSGNSSCCRTDLRVDSTLVQIPITVTDRRGSFVHDLPRSAFRVFEDGVEQEVNTFSAGDTPVSVGLIFDTSGSMETKLPMARLALAHFLKTARPEDEFFLLLFDTLPRPTSVLTNDVGRLLEEVVRAEASGSTALLDTLFVGLHEIKKAHDPRRVLLVISDGEDNHSRYTHMEIRKAVRESDVQIYAIGLREIVYSKRGRRIIPRGAELLRALCNDTGGRSFAVDVDDKSDLPRIADRIGFEIRNEYVLGYRPTNRRWDGKYRHVAVKIIQPPGFPGLRAYWRRGYSAPQETTP